MIYLDNAAGSNPKPESVHDESARALRALSGFPRESSHGPARAAATLMAETRAQAAELFGLAGAKGVVFTAGGTDAPTMALKGLLKGALKPILHGIEAVFGTGQLAAVMLILLSAVLIFTALMLLVRVMRSAMHSRVEAIDIRGVLSLRSALITGLLPVLPSIEIPATPPTH